MSARLMVDAGGEGVLASAEIPLLEGNRMPLICPRALGMPLDS